MKIKKISNNEVAVFLTNGDLELFDLRPESFEPKSAELHKFLFVLMETVREETGFDPYDGQVVVEASKTKSGVHLSISKIGSAQGAGNGKISRDDFNRVKGVRIRSVAGARQGAERDVDISQRDTYKSVYGAQRRNVQLKRRRSVKKRDGSFVFVFGSYTDLESALRLTHKINIAQGELYRSGKRYAMILTIPSIDGCYDLMEFTESHCRSNMAADRVRECWMPVVRGEKLAEMADAVRDMA